MLSNLLPQRLKLPVLLFGFHLAECIALFDTLLVLLALPQDILFDALSSLVLFNFLCVGVLNQRSESARLLHQLLHQMLLFSLLAQLLLLLLDGRSLRFRPRFFALLDELFLFFNSLVEHGGSDRHLHGTG